MDGVMTSPEPSETRRKKWTGTCCGSGPYEEDLNFIYCVCVPYSGTLLPPPPPPPSQEEEEEDVPVVITCKVSAATTDNLQGKCGGAYHAKPQEMGLRLRVAEGCGKCG